MAKKPIKPCPLGLKEWVDYLRSFIEYQNSSTHTAQQNDFTKIIIILTVVNISFLWLNLFTEYNIYAGEFKMVALITVPPVVVYLILKFLAIHSQAKRATRENETANQTRKLINDIIKGEYTEDELDKIRTRYQEIWKIKN